MKNVIVFFSFLFCIAANAATYYVSPKGSDENSGSSESPFATITNAVAKADADGEIVLMKGTHSAKVTLTKKLTIRGETGNRDDVIIQSTGIPTIDFSAGSDGSIIRDFTIQGAAGGNGEQGSAVSFNKPGSIINCRMTQCTCAGGAGSLSRGAGGVVWVKSGIAATIKDCLFDNNISTTASNGIGLFGNGRYGKAKAMIYIAGNNSLVENCTITNNSYVGWYEYGYVLGIRATASCTIKDCEIAYNTAHFLDSQPEENPWILKTDGVGALCQNISIHDNHYWGVRQNLTASSVKDPNAIISEENNGPLYPQSTPEVESRSVSDIDGLLAAIEAAEPWSEIVLQPGPYTLNAILDIKKPITIRGATGNRDDVIISGNANNYWVRLWTDGATVKDLTVKNAAVKKWYNMGAAIAIFGGGSAINCRVTGINSVFGGILGIRNYNGIVRNVLIDGNEVTNREANNLSYGNGFYWQKGSLALLDRSIVANNRALKVYSPASEPSKYLFSSGLFIIGGVVRNTQVSGNRMEYNNNYVTESTSIAANRKALGIYMDGANTVIENCSVIDNISSGGVPQDNVAGIVCVNGTIKNTLVWNNGDENGAKIVNYLGDKSKYSYLASDDVTDIEGGVKLTETPYQYESGVAMPLTGAAMLGKGLLDPTWMTAEAKDLAGNPRLADGKVSIGVTEFVSKMTVTWEDAVRHRAYERYSQFVEAGQVTGDTKGLEYWWDLDGDGVFEAKGPKQYLDLTKVGETVVTLKVTNSNGGSATFSQKFTIESYSNVMYVSKDNAGAAAPYSTPETAAARVEDALNLAPDGTRIIVAPSTYSITETLMLTNEVKIVGATGNRDDVIFDAEDKRRVAWLDNENTAVENVTFTRGRTEGPAFCVYSKGVLKNCRICNSRMLYAGGSGADSPHSALRVAGGIVEDCLIDGNYIHSQYGNHRQPEGIGIYQSAGIVDRCVIVNNYLDPVKRVLCRASAGGVYLAGGIMRNSLLATNSLVGATVYLDFVDNYASGAIVTGGTFINNTVVGNECEEISTTYPYVLSSLIVKGSGVVKNTLVKDNILRSTQVEQAPVALGAGQLVNCSTAENSYFFRNGELRIKANSPCCNNGSNEEWMAYATDLNGKPRLHGRRVDIGAVESQSDGMMIIIK